VARVELDPWSVGEKLAAAIAQAACHCQRFDIDVQNTSSVVNRIRVRAGHARLDCQFPEGGALNVNLKFDGCR
jgi:hypothetical protein